MAAINVYMYPIELNFLLVSTTKKNPDLSFSSDRKLYQMRDREEGQERERVCGEKRGIEINIERSGNAKTKSVDVEQTPKDPGMEF